MQEKLKYVIYAPPYNEDSGGIIALHKLCHLLNKYGEEAYIYPWDNEFRFYAGNWFLESLRLIRRFIFHPIFKIHRCGAFIRYIFWARKRKNWIRHVISALWKLVLAERENSKGFLLNKSFITPILYYIEPDDYVVIYSEMVEGNPTKSKKIVRWFLHKPGYHTGHVNYGLNELYFFFQPKFNDPKVNPDSDNLLQILHVPLEIYHQTNFGSRHGSCYVLRKGEKRALVHNLHDSVLIDGRSHREIAAIFNRCEICISYDTDTLFSHLAVLCGCKSVVVPEEGVSKREWQPQEELSYGIAYGFSDIEEADKTKSLLIQLLQKNQDLENQSVRKMIRKCEEKFSCLGYL